MISPEIGNVFNNVYHTLLHLYCQNIQVATTTIRKSVVIKYCKNLFTIISRQRQNSFIRSLNKKREIEKNTFPMNNSF